jgi:hypothetical protein
MKINLESKINIWKNKLLDLGKRNRLLNYKETKRSSLQILTPDCVSLWKSFVQDEKPVEFPYYDEFSTDLVEESSYSIETNQTVKEMQKTLRSLRDKAKIANEEQGTNILYLSFGFLKWKESANSDYIFSSPIILVPVKLTVESIASPYILSLHEDEIVINPTLCHKLETDFGITLLEFNEDIDVKHYLENIQKLVTNNQWEVSFEASLSLLSFLKINMFKDLEWHNDKIKQNSIVRAISGDADACEKIPEELINFDFDSNLKPTQIFQVVDADSSQMDAILCAKRGISFVLQGPPGTGKSQTITNIISECLADGKKVLFVSEKMAALEVVHKRLTNAELDDFCLILHSYKANKRAVLDQLGNVLKIAEKKVQLNDEAYQKLNALQSDKEKLNDYANQLVEKVTPLDKSIFEANGILAHLASYEEIIFSIENIDKITKEQLNRQLYLLEQFSSTIGKMSEDYSHNPWNGATVVAVTFELLHDIGANLPKLISKVSNAIQSIKQICDELALKWEYSYSTLQLLVPILDIAKQSPIVPVSWIIGNEILPLFDEITKCEHRKSLFLRKLNDLKTQYQIVSANDNAISILDATNLTDTVSIQREIDKIKSILSTFPYLKWSLANTRLFSLYEGTKRKSENLNELRNAIVLQFENGIFDIDFQSIYNRYKTDYTSIFKFFKKSYREDKKAIRVHYKTIIKKVTDEMALNILNKLRTHAELTKCFAEHNAELTSYFGKLYHAEKQILK